MGAKAQQFIPKGMRRDYSASKADPQFAFENHNIRITTREDKQAFYIVITDDGVGIDPNCEPDSRIHVGIENVRMRVEAMCCGQLNVESRLGEGTTVTIRIPKKS